MNDCKFYDSITSRCRILFGELCDEARKCTFYITEKQFAESEVSAIEKNLLNGNCRSCKAGIARQKTCMKALRKSGADMSKYDLKFLTKEV